MLPALSYRAYDNLLRRPTDSWQSSRWHADKLQKTITGINDSPRDRMIHPLTQGRTNLWRRSRVSKTEVTFPYTLIHDQPDPLHSLTHSCTVSLFLYLLSQAHARSACPLACHTFMHDQHHGLSTCPLTFSHTFMHYQPVH